MRACWALSSPGIRVGREGGRDEHVDRRRERGRRRKLKQQQRIQWGCSRLEMKLFFSAGAYQWEQRSYPATENWAITGAPGFLSPLQASWSTSHIQRLICFQSQNRDRWTLQTHTCKSHILICTQVVQRRTPYQSDQFRHAWLMELRFFQYWGNHSSPRPAVQLQVGGGFLWIFLFSSSSRGSTAQPSPILAAF